MTIHIPVTPTTASSRSDELLVADEQFADGYEDGLSDCSIEPAIYHGFYRLGYDSALLTIQEARLEGWYIHGAAFEDYGDACLA